MKVELKNPEEFAIDKFSNGRGLPLILTGLEVLVHLRDSYPTGHPDNRIVHHLFYHFSAGCQASEQ
jgi:hypothetical protein